MPPEARLGSTLVWYKADKLENLEYWYKEIDTFLTGKWKQKNYSAVNSDLFHNIMYGLCFVDRLQGC